MVRYLTRTCAAVDARLAERLAEGDGTRPHELEVTEGVEVVHAQNGWAFWSDGKLSTSTGLPEALRVRRSLSAAAVELISHVRHSSPGAPALAGGWQELARVEAWLEDQVVEEGQAEEPFEPPRLHRLQVRLRNGAERVWWVRTAASFEGVTFALSDAPGPN